VLGGHQEAPRLEVPTAEALDVYMNLLQGSLFTRQENSTLRQKQKDNTGPTDFVKPGARGTPNLTAAWVLWTVLPK
jgi:hypothetical protein